jgi:hypothetical protein
MAYRYDARPTDLNVDPEEILAAQRRARKKKLVALAISDTQLASDVPLSARFSRS